MIINRKKTEHPPSTAKWPDAGLVVLLSFTSYKGNLNITTAGTLINEITAT
jgi:hypothetical protein